MYPQIRGATSFALIMHSFPWLIDTLGALFIAWIGYILIPKKVWVFVGVLLLALCIAWPDGSYVLAASTLGWKSVLLFTPMFWLAVLKAGLVIFNLVLWTHAVVFFSIAILTYILFNRTHRFR